jgi:hypothetical protein
MNAYYHADQEDEQLRTDHHMHKPHYSALYIITHIILSFFAIYLSWRCAGTKFEIFNFSVALFCPHLYIIWALATHGGCGVFDNIPVTTSTRGLF